MIEAHGGCHCGNIEVTLHSAKEADELQVRACQCGFCRRHGVRTVTDAEGRVSITVADAQALSRYRFGKGVAEFLVCRRCGTYVAAYLETPERAIATLNINVLADSPFAHRDGHAANYDGESAEASVARRLAMWTPATLHGA